MGKCSFENNLRQFISELFEVDATYFNVQDFCFDKDISTFPTDFERWLETGIGPENFEQKALDFIRNKINSF